MQTIEIDSMPEMGHLEVQSGNWVKRLTILVAVASSMSACGSENASEGMHVEELPVLALEEDLRIGSVEDPNVGFTSIGSVWMSPQSELYVSETRALEIRVYSTEGQLLRSYGRGGEGPGEFRSIRAFGVVGDTLWVSDGTLARTTLFGPDGNLAGTITARVEVPIGDMRGRPLTVSVVPDALRPDGLIGSAFIRAISPNLPDSIVYVPELLFDRNGQVVDTVEMVRTLVSRPARVIERDNGASYVYLDPPRPDSGSYEVKVGAGTFKVRWSVAERSAVGTLSAVLSDPGGDTIASTVLGYDPRPVTEHYLDSLAASRARGPWSSSDSLTLYNAYRSATQLPPHHVPVQSPVVVGDGSIWVRIEPNVPSRNRWLLFRLDGQVLGTLSIPLGAFPRWSHNGEIWLMERDALDVPWLVRYRVAGL